MPLNVPVSKGKRVEIDDGTWPALCVKVDEKTIENDKFGNGHKCILWFEFPDFTDDETGEYVRLDAMANFVISPKSKLYEWLTALQVEVDLEAAEVDAEQAVGHEAFVEIEHVEKDGTAWPRVKNISKKAKGRNTPEPKMPASVINPDGSTNWTAFWSQITAAGLNRKHVIDHVGDIDLVMAMDGPLAAQCLEELLAKAHG